MAGKPLLKRTRANARHLSWVMQLRKARARDKGSWGATSPQARSKAWAEIQGHAAGMASRHAPHHSRFFILSSLSPVLSKFGWFWFVYKCLLNFRYCGGDLILYWKSNANSSTNEGLSPASSSRRRLYIPSRTTHTADSSDVQVAKRDTCDAFLAPVCCACHTVRRCLAVCGLRLRVVRFHCCYGVQLHCCCFVCLVADSVSCSWH